MEPRTPIIIVLIFLSLSSTIVSSSNISAIFAFGDSTIDTGNNDFLITTSRSDHQPYGKDFPNQIPTGRFSDGKLPIDFLASAFGLKDLLPPYLAMKPTDDKELLTGACFPSAGSWLDPSTAASANVLNLTTQINLFDGAMIRIRRLVGVERAKFIVEKGLFFISTGSNDFINFYNSGLRSFQFNISSYQDFVLKQLQAAIHRLYNAGGRRFAVSGLPPIGCLPSQITLRGNSVLHKCKQQQNIESAVFNGKLQILVTKLQSQLPGSRVAYLDAYSPLLDRINNPAKYGIEETLKGCCGTGLFEQGQTCREPSIQVCFLGCCPSYANSIFRRSKSYTSSHSTSY